MDSGLEERMKDFENQTKKDVDFENEEFNKF